MKTKQRITSMINYLFGAQRETETAVSPAQPSTLYTCPKTDVSLLLPDVRQPDTDIKKVSKMVLAYVLEKPLQQFRLLDERNGRVVMVCYQPYAYFDPVLPLPLVNMGDIFNREYRVLAECMSGWVSNMYRLLQVWNDYRAAVTMARANIYRMPSRPAAVVFDTTFAYGRVRNLIQIAIHSGLLTHDELGFFQLKAWECVTHPDMFLQYESDVNKALWNRAAVINAQLGR